MIEESKKLMLKLIQIAEWAIDNEVPIDERLRLIPKIHEVILSIRKELPNMSNVERSDLGIQLVLLESIVKSGGR